ncbi:MAG: 4-alpha-glucanotransferase [Ilumatobacter fluminis]|uniref:4-alpha-glucanotransferase n=1 Tax=Ilumatobacter fluminis TaxID=467091 RepID=UPI0032EFF672
MTETAPFPSRCYGVLMHPTSFPGPEPIGTLGAEAHEFVDWLATTGASIWQILPLTYLGSEDSPYFSPSSFAGNTWLIDLRELVAAGLIAGIGTPPRGDEIQVDFEAMRTWKAPLLDAAAGAFLDDDGHPWWPDYERFVADSPWLADVCHFIARKHADPVSPWWDWDPAIRRREPAALAASAIEHAAAIEREQVLQFFFDRQWQAVRARANAAGIVVLGDTPIYVAPDSADVWAHQSQFQLDDDGRLTAQAGVPPDYFSETGQLWGNPIYRWDVMADDGFSWWIDRLGRTLEQTGIVRIDHFRALSAYWSVPADDDTAIDGTWMPGPGQAFVDAVGQAFPSLPIVAEDLGDLDDDVLALRDRNDLVGMRVLQFGFDGPPNDHHPSRIVERSVVYTGTHDNDTLAGWWTSSPRRRKERVRRDTGMPPRVRTRKAVWSLIETVLASPAVAAVVPVQDLLVLGSEARMNLPGTATGNWQWRLRPGALTERLASDLRSLAESTNR